MNGEKKAFSVDEIIEEAKNNQSIDDNDFYENIKIETGEAPKKTKKRSWFSRKDKTPDYNEQDDAYYGIEIKPLNELRKGFDSTGEIMLLEGDTFTNLFDNTMPSLDDEVEKNFQRIQRERRRRVAEAVESAGVNADDVADELGVVAPMPVTSFSADPYTKQHGISSNSSESTDFEKAMMHTAEFQTMEIKLNVLNDTIELQKNINLPAVDSETVNKILETAEISKASDIEQALNASKIIEIADISSDTTIADDVEEETILPGNIVFDDTEELILDSYSAEDTADQISFTDFGEEPSFFANKDISSYTDQSDDRDDFEAISKPEKTKVRAPIPQKTADDFPEIDTLEHYRKKTMPIHVINIDVLQSSILTESAEYEKNSEPAKPAPFSRFMSKIKPEEEVEETESIDDYTSPADAKSISHELRSSMRQLSMRLLVTGLSTAILLVTTLIYEGMFATGNSEASATPYLIITLALVLASACFCYKSVISGLKKLMQFNATSDSAISLALFAVLIQTTLGFLNQSAITSGGAHLFGLVLVFVLFLNNLGKLTMLRRIHSNFRFITAREQKYAVKIYDDYNTSLKMAQDCVAEAPVIAYQKKTSFLKRFLQLSYDADPSEAASQALAPIGFIISLLLCFVVLFITKDIYIAITSFTAACCVCVAAVNMLAVNLPVSRLCKKARRAGAMLIGYDAVEQMAKTNAIMMDASELFPVGTVVLDGVKTFGATNIEASMLCATAIIKEIGGTLADVFKQVITETDEELPRVTNLVLEDEHGISGSISGKNVLIGNRTLLLNHKIDPPDRNEIIKYTSGGKKVLFIAIDGHIDAMLVLTYKADKRKRIELQRLEENGVSVIVRSTDANITQTFVGKLFGISPSSVSILTSTLAETYDELVKDEIPRSDAVVATKGRVESLMHVVSACVSEKKIITLIIALQNIAVILGFVLVAFLSCFSGIKQLTAIAILLYELFWVTVLLILPRIKKP